MDHSSMPGMDGMSSSSSSHSEGSMTMNAFFTASTPTVPLWFSGWQPGNAGTTFGACLGLCALAMLARLLGAVRHQASVGWSLGRWHDSGLGTHSVLEKIDQTEQVEHQSILRPLRPIPWIASQEIPRGVLAALHTGLEYFLMLAVMTFNVYFFIAIVFGVFIGEVAFGRWSTIHGSHG